MGNPVVHFELQGPDPDGTAKFYSQLFGWHAESMPGEQPYVVIDTHAGKGINGGFGKTQEGQPPNATFYVETPDPEKALKKAESLGAKTVMPVTEVPGIVTFALFADPQGAVIGIVKSSEGQQDQGGVSAGSNPAVAWFDILSADPKKAWDFYSELFDWHVKDSSGEGFVYGEVDTNAGKGINGGIGSSPDGQPHVNIYAEVDNIQKYLDKAESLGGKTIVPPMEAGNVKFAQFADPQGTTLGLLGPASSTVGGAHLRVGKESSEKESEFQERADQERGPSMAEIVINGMVVHPLNVIYNALTPEAAKRFGMGIDIAIAHVDHERWPFTSDIGELFSVAFYVPHRLDLSKSLEAPVVVTQTMVNDGTRLDLRVRGERDEGTLAPVELGCEPIIRGSLSCTCAAALGFHLFRTHLSRDLNQIGILNLIDEYRMPPEDQPVRDQHIVAYLQSRGSQEVRPLDDESDCPYWVECKTQLGKRCDFNRIKCKP